MFVGPTGQIIIQTQSINHFVSTCGHYVMLISIVSRVKKMGNKSATEKDMISASYLSRSRFSPFCSMEVMIVYHGGFSVSLHRQNQPTVFLYFQKSKKMSFWSTFGDTFLNNSILMPIDLDNRYFHYITQLHQLKQILLHPSIP